MLIAPQSVLAIMSAVDEYTPVTQALLETPLYLSDEERQMLPGIRQEKRRGFGWNAVEYGGKLE